jgi:hypothetical protein
MKRWDGKVEVVRWDRQSSRGWMNYSFRKRLKDQMIFISSHHHFILHAWTIRLRTAFAYLRRFVSFISSSICWLHIESFNDIQSRWFLSYLLIFEIIERSMSSKIRDTMLMRSDRSDNEIQRWLDQKKNSRDERRSRFSKRSRWIMR